MKLQIKMLDPALEVPARAYEGDAGLDLRSRIDMDLLPGERAMLPTGMAVAIPEGYAGFVQPRSGLAIHHGITCLNSPGLIDSHYRGEICVILINHDRTETLKVTRGDKIAQLVIMAVRSPELVLVEELDKTQRGESGFGSSGRS